MVKLSALWKNVSICNVIQNRRLLFFSFLTSSHKAGNKYSLLKTFLAASNEHIPPLRVRRRVYWKRHEEDFSRDMPFGVYSRRRPIYSVAKLGISLKALNNTTEVRQLFSKYSDTFAHLETFTRPNPFNTYHYN